MSCLFNMHKNQSVKTTTYGFYGGLCVVIISCPEAVTSWNYSFQLMVTGLGNASVIVLGNNIYVAGGNMASRAAIATTRSKVTRWTLTSGVS